MAPKVRGELQRRAGSGPTASAAASLHLPHRTAAARLIPGSGNSSSCLNRNHACIPLHPPGGQQAEDDDSEVEALLQRVSESRHAGERRDAMGQLRDLLQDNPQVDGWMDGWMDG